MPDFFDRLVQEIVHSASSPASHPVASPAARRGRARTAGSKLARPWSRRRLLAGVVLLCVPGTLGGLAIAGTFGGQRISPQQWVDGLRVQPEMVMTPAQTAYLGILRRSRGPSDTLLAWDAFSITHSPMAASGVNPALSRRVEGISSGAAWVIPGNGVVCLIGDNAQALAMSFHQTSSGDAATTPPARVPGANGATGCMPDADASRGWSAGTSSTAETPGTIFTAGLVPDGVNEVSVNIAAGPSLSLPVHENVYMAEVHGWPASVSFSGPEGAVTIGNGPAVPSSVHHQRGFHPLRLVARK
jgi:hypothetical protein